VKATRAPSSRHARFFLEAAAVASVYALAAKLGTVAFAGGAGAVTAVWPPTGIAVAALLLLGPRASAGVAAGALAAELLTGRPAPAAAVVATANTLAAVAGYLLLKRFRFRPALERAVDVFELAFLGGFVPMTLSATLASLARPLTHAHGTWLGAWIGDSMGVVLVAPVILTFAADRWRRLRAHVLPSAAVVAATGAAAWLVLFRGVVTLQSVVLVLVVVGALLLYQAGAALISVVTSTVGLAGIVHGHLLDPTMGAGQNLIYAQTLNVALAVTSLALAAAVSQRVRAEDELRRLAAGLERRVRERTRLLAETQRLGRIGSFSWEALTDTNEWSDELYRIYGMTPGEVPPSFEQYLARVHPDDVDAVRAELEAAITVNRPFEHDYRISHPSGGERWVHAFGEPVLSADGAVIGLQGTCQDVTDRKVAEEATKASERRLLDQAAALQESQRIARIGSFRWDQRTRVNVWSEELFDIHGLPVGEHAPGEEYRDLIHPGDWDDVHAFLARSYATLEPYEHEYRIVRPDGEVRWIHAHGEPISDDAGNYIGMQGTCQDVTERRRAEDAVRASEERFRALVGSAPDAAVVVDDAGQIVLVNEEATKLFGYEPDEMVGRSVDMLVPDESRVVHRRDRNAYMADPRRRGMGADRELWAQRKDGARIPVSINLSSVHTEAGSLVIAVVRDITERRMAEASMRDAYERERAAADNLRALDEAKTVFLEAVSHELRTPLTVIVGIASLLREGDLRRTDDVFPELVASLDTSAHRLEHLLDDLLDLDRLGRGIVKPHRRRTAVADLAARVVAALDIGRHVVHVDAHEVVADVDPAQTERIVENLVANALKHTPPETPVWVRAESAEGGVVIVVEDAGPGVPDNIRDTVFAPFVKDTRGHVPGTGIGLSLVLRFAALHGGRAWVDTRPGGGASFHVYLPSQDAPVATEEVA
jgi:PAS domain S-box-containing protein